MPQAKRQPQDDEKPDAETVGTDKLPPKDDVEQSDEPTFTVERLLNEGDRTLDVPLSVVAGAFHDQPPTREVTLSYAKQRVRDWLKAEDSTQPTPQDAATL